jgi:hypothetical protein
MQKLNEILIYLQEYPEEIERPVITLTIDKKVNFKNWLALAE